MKDRKIFGYGIAVIFALALALALATTACGDGDGDDDPGHTHEYSTAWQSNATQHWRECTANDGAKTDVANHTGDPCSVCSYSWTWTAVTDSTFPNDIFGDINAIAYGNGRFVAVGGSGKMAYSADGENWTAVEDSTFGTGYSDDINAIAYGNAGNAGGRFVAGGDSGKMAYSEDGEKWTAVEDSTFPNNNKGNINAIAYGNNRFVAVGGSGKMAYSEDGENWTAVEDSTFPAESSYDLGDNVLTFLYSINSIAYGGGRFVAGGSDGTMAYSADGENWTAVEDSKFTFSIYAIAYGNNKFAAGGYLGEMAYSVDGENWTAVTDSTIWEYPYTIDNIDEPFTSMLHTHINAIAYGSNRFVAVSEQGKMAYSADGASWTAVADSKFLTTYTFEDETFTSTIDINGIAYGGGRFVAVGENGKMAYANW